MDTGDHVIVINADKVVLTGKKLVQKVYFRHSGYLGGDSYTKAGDMLAKNPVKMVELAVKGMIPKIALAARSTLNCMYMLVLNTRMQLKKPETLEINVR